MAWTILTFVGIIYAIKLGWYFIINIHAGIKAYLYPYVSTRKNFRIEFGRWGVVTGCTQGIGREYALGLAERGMHMVLVGRNKGRLEEVENEIRSAYDVDTLVIVVDLSENEAPHIIAQQIQGLDIGILVNNAGIAGDHMMPFLDQDKDLLKCMVMVNMSVVVMLTHTVLPIMKRKGRGAVINISSIASLMPPMPYLTLYSATKQFVHAFTEALECENRGSGVIFQEVTPGVVETSLTKHLPRSRFNRRATPRQFVKSAILTIGFTNTTCGWWQHGLYLFLFQTLPDLLGRISLRKALKNTYRIIISSKES